MNAVLPSRFSERLYRLQLGIQPMDALRGQRIPHLMDIVVEPRPWEEPLTADQTRWLIARAASGIPLSDSWVRAMRYASSRYSLQYAVGRGPFVDLRFLDASERLVPRRLRVPLATLGSPENVTVLDALPVGRRSRFPAFFPGATYPMSERSTGMRGRVVVSDGGAPAQLLPVRWPRVEARLPTGGAPIAWAHGDQYGEFLLILPPQAIASPAVELPRTLSLDVTAHGRRSLPAVLPSELVRRADPFWDLPLEELGDPADAPSDDLVALGQTVPGDYDGSFTRSVTFTYSAIVSSGVPPFDIT